jgi:hypothetical protein
MFGFAEGEPKQAALFPLAAVTLIVWAMEKAAVKTSTVSKSILMYNFIFMNIGFDN